MKRAAISVTLGVVLSVQACTNVGQERVEVPLFVAGSTLASPLQARGDIALRIERAELAFGPLYLCAGASAGELCETARLEWLGSQVVDLTSPTPAEAGKLTGTSGPVRSFMYDLGISAQLTREEPFVLEAAQTLGDASLRVVGSAELSGRSVRFQAKLAIQQTSDTEMGVPVIRKSSSERFSHDVEPGESGLLVRFDAASWLTQLDLSPYLQDASCTEDGPKVVCAQNTELRCDDAGSASEPRDCSALDQTCIHGQGCADELSVEPDSETYRVLRAGLLTGARPRFTWGYEGTSGRAAQEP